MRVLRTLIAGCAATLGVALWGGVSFGFEYVLEAAFWAGGVIFLALVPLVLAYTPLEVCRERVAVQGQTNQAQNRLDFQGPRAGVVGVGTLLVLLSPVPWLIPEVRALAPGAFLWNGVTFAILGLLLTQLRWGAVVDFEQGYAERWMGLGWPQWVVRKTLKPGLEVVLWRVVPSRQYARAVYSLSLEDDEGGFCLQYRGTSSPGNAKNLARLLRRDSYLLVTQAASSEAANSKPTSRFFGSYRS